MKKQIRLLLRFQGLFGRKDGIRLWRQVRRKQLDNLRLPGLKAAISLRPKTSDLATFYQVFVNGEYNVKFPDNPKVIIDCGANVGMFSLYAKNKFPDARLICIEPDKSNFEVLQKNLSAYSDVSLENAGLWNRETGLRIHDKYEMGNWAMVVEETDDQPDLHAISMDRLMSKYALQRIDILKIDIETSEKSVFAAGYENWLPKVKMIIIELHDWMEPGCAKPFFAAINECFKNYEYGMKGENTIIINKDIP